MGEKAGGRRGPRGEGFGQVLNVGLIGPTSRIEEPWAARAMSDAPTIPA
jgi:hypothetical protein